MDREDIIRMALKADMRVGTNLSGVVLVGSPAEIGLAHLTIEELERFAALVAAAERERIIAANAPEIERVNAYIAALEKAVAAEREACAKVCEEEICNCCWDDDAKAAAEHLAAAIRARGNT